MKIIAMRPPKIAMALLATAFALHWLSPIWETLKFSFPLAGVGIGSLGFAIMMWGWWLFRQHKVAICPTAHTDKLIFDGPYRFTRNPMYLGMVAMLLGVAIFVGTLPFFLGVVIYFVILNRVFVPFEEQKLESTFGSEYLEYRRQIRRWF
ncbi:MAG: isoprenylcysteine carboxylmethyltransferase family protein [Deltaproteobacteria bacterium]|nr:isoprenylcysteine carboxylmethyltransferase family protein [Deltaproteobacteria bacterium]